MTYDFHAGGARAGFNSEKYDPDRWWNSPLTAFDASGIPARWYGICADHWCVSLTSLCTMQMEAGRVSDVAGLRGGQRHVRSNVEITKDK